MTRHRVIVFDRPHGPWRETREHAMEDAVAEGLASLDETKREHFLAVPVDIMTDWEQPGQRHPLADAYQSITDQLYYRPRRKPKPHRTNAL